MTPGSRRAGSASSRAVSQSSHNRPSRCVQATKPIHDTAWGADHPLHELIAPRSNSSRQSKPASRADRIGHVSATVSAHPAASVRVPASSDHRDQEDERSSDAVRPVIQKMSSTVPSRPAASRRTAGASTPANTQTACTSGLDDPPASQPATARQRAQQAQAGGHVGMNPDLQCRDGDCGDDDGALAEAFEGWRHGMRRGQAGGRRAT